MYLIDIQSDQVSGFLFCWVYNFVLRSRSTIKSVKANIKNNFVQYRSLLRYLLKYTITYKNLFVYIYNKRVGSWSYFSSSTIRLQLKKCALGFTRSSYENISSDDLLNNYLRLPECKYVCIYVCFLAFQSFVSNISMMCR